MGHCEPIFLIHLNNYHDKCESQDNSFMVRKYLTLGNGSYTCVHKEPTMNDEERYSMICNISGLAFIAGTLIIAILTH